MKEQDEDHTLLNMPSVEGSADYIINLLIQVGISQSNGMGLAALTWSELCSWSNITMIDLSSWEAETLIDLSRQFTASLSEYDEKDVPAPYIADDYDRERVSQSIGDRLRSLAKRINKDG